MSKKDEKVARVVEEIKKQRLKFREKTSSK